MAVGDAPYPIGRNATAHRYTSRVWKWNIDLGSAGGTAGGSEFAYADGYAYGVNTSLGGSRDP